MKKKPLASLRRNADALLQKHYVSLNKTCLVCGGPAQVMHHFIPKSRSNYLRYEPKNLIPLCHSCHCLHHTSGDPAVEATILKKKGWLWFEDLQEHRRIICKFTREYLEGVIKDLDGNN